MRTIRAFIATAAVTTATILLTGCRSVPVNASPVPTVTVTAPATVPAVCLMALDEADKTIAVAADTMDIVQDTFDDIANWDVAAIRADTKRLDQQTAELKQIRYAEYRDQCKKEEG